MRANKRNKFNIKYLSLKDIKEINDAFLAEIERVKRRLMGVSDADIINAFFEVISNGYSAAIELRAREREVDYNIKLAEIEARALEMTPVRHPWTWRLLFRPLTNRAQDIIEERAELDADRIHTEAEKKLDDDYKKFFPDTDEKLSKRELRRLVREQLKAAIETADEADTNETFNEPPKEPPAAPSDVQTVQENASKPANQLPGQMTLDDVQPQVQEQQSPPPFTSGRRPRPPRNCRQR